MMSNLAERSALMLPNSYPRQGCRGCRVHPDIALRARYPKLRRNAARAVGRVQGRSQLLHLRVSGSHICAYPTIVYDAYIGLVWDSSD